ncbi:Mak10 protein [Maudiozyma humilis]|uniref:Mak10 protein n=1 Tax=Maudiozyma humilis TaxID=51915 RepID=A0AAV5RQJ4_MAUHU|nr:Mak10 protein [Kazachstania humilis]
MDQPFAETHTQTQMDGLASVLSGLQVQPKGQWPPSDMLCSVKELLQQQCAQLNAEDIVKERGFDLFEGTHSLEINNEKLDSHLIELSPDEVDFDCAVAYPVDSAADDGQCNWQYVTAVLDRLARLIVTWVSEYQSLPTTVLSCRYVEHVLVQIARGKSGDHAYISTGNEFHDNVLNAGVLGVCYFGAFVKKLLRGGGIFEEEDLNFNSMGLDGFDNMPQRSVVRQLLASALHMVQSADIPQDDNRSRLAGLLQLIDCLVQMDQYLTEYATDKQPLRELATVATALDALPPHNYKVPSGSFSMRIQKTMSNQFPPKTLVQPASSFCEYTRIARDFMKVLDVHSAESSFEMTQFAFFFNKNEQVHVLARGLFPLVMIRDDSTFLGKYTFPDAFKMHLQGFSLAGSRASDALDSEPFRSLIDPISQEALSALFEWYQNNAQNTARYRQGYNRQLLLWDSVQAQFESLETNFAGSEEDMVSQNPGDPGVPLMPFASWAFVMKTISMIEFVLKGFDLDVYKPFESFNMFWFTFYLTQQLDACLVKVDVFVQSKIDSIHAINKRMKKQKAGEKKEKLRAQYHEAMEKQMPDLQRNKLYLKYLMCHNDMTKCLSLYEAFQFGLLKSYGVIDTKSPSASKFVNDKLIHDLRFKPFSSIGVPELPSYEVFQEVLGGFVISEPMFKSKVTKTEAFMNEQLKSASNSIDAILKCIKAKDKGGQMFTGTGLIAEDATIYYERLAKTIDSLAENNKSIINTLGASANAELAKKFHVELALTPGLSGYYPLMKLVPTKPRAKK